MPELAYGVPMQYAATLFKALADEERLRLLALLLYERDGACVCELVDALRIPQYQISRQLGVLRHAGLVIGERRGTWVYYKTPTDRPPLTVAVLESLAAHSESETSREDRERFESRVRLREGGVCTVGYLAGAPFRQVIPVLGEAIASVGDAMKPALPCRYHGQHGVAH